MSYRKAIEIAQAQRARLFELRGATSLARLHGVGGQTEQAIRDLESALAAIDGGDDTRDVLAAQALLRLARDQRPTA